jgi:hypothetical protein
MATKKKPAAKAATKKVPATKTTATKPAAAKKSAAKAPAAKAKAKPKPAPNMGERMEGLQGWMAEIERKQERMTKIGGGAAILAVLLSGGALALGIINKQDASSKDDVDNLTEQVNELGASIKSDTEEQLKAINGRVDAIEQQVKTIQQTQTTQTQDIATLKSQQSAVPGAIGGQQNGLDVQPGVTTPPATPDGN